MRREGTVPVLWNSATNLPRLTGGSISSAAALAQRRHKSVIAPIRSKTRVGTRQFESNSSQQIANIRPPAQELWHGADHHDAES